MGEQGRLTVVVRPADAAEAQLPQHDRTDQAERVERVEPEHPADPEAADASLALEGRRDDVPADHEEHEDAVLARVEPLVDDLPGVLEHVIAQVIEDHEQGGHTAQRVQPGKPAARRNRWGG